MPPAEAPMPTMGIVALLRDGPASCGLFVSGFMLRAAPLSPRRRRPGAHGSIAQQLLHDLDVVLIVARPRLETLSQRMALTGAFVLGHAMGQRRTLLVRTQKGPQ